MAGPYGLGYNPIVYGLVAGVDARRMDRRKVRQGVVAGYVTFNSQFNTATAKAGVMWRW